MKKEYNFAEMKGRKNPYAKSLKKQVTLRLGIDVIEYFKNLAAETGIPLSEPDQPLPPRVRPNRQKTNPLLGFIAF